MLRVRIFYLPGRVEEARDRERERQFPGSIRELRSVQKRQKSPGGGLCRTRETPNIFKYADFWAVSVWGKSGKKSWSIGESSVHTFRRNEIRQLFPRWR